MAYASAEMSRVFGQYVAWNGRVLPVLLERLAEDLTGDLFYQTSALRPSQQKKIDDLPTQLSWKIKRRLRKDVGNEQTALAIYNRGPKKGQFKSKTISSQIRRASDSTHVTVPEELKLRKRFTAIFQASGWISNTLHKIGSRGRKFIRMEPQAVVVKQVADNQLRVTVTNPRPNSAEFATQNGILELAAGYRTGRMLQYIRKHAARGASEFSRPRPNFNNVNVINELERAMAGFSSAT